LVPALIVMLTGCSLATTSGSHASGPVEATEAPVSTSASERAGPFPIETFASLGDEPVSDDLAAELQDVLEEAADGDGVTAAVISPEGAWTGATGFAAGDREMVPNDQMPIGQITETIVAAEVMQLVDEGRLSLDDLAADLIPPDLEFDTNGARVVDLLSHRSGLPTGPSSEKIAADPLHAWTPGEVLATVRPARRPAGRRWEFSATNGFLLGLIIEYVTGRHLGEVLRSDVLDGDGFERLIFQPDERPTKPIAMPSGSVDILDQVGDSLPSLAQVTADRAHGNMASDAASLARWFRALCAGQVVSEASLDEMSDFEERSEYGLGIWDRRSEYGTGSGALGLTGLEEGYRTAALCFQNPGAVVVVLANDDGYDVDTLAGELVDAAST
jgi:D-alanyl-D-alanine carboxypeptidase